MIGISPKGLAGVWVSALMSYIAFLSLWRNGVLPAIWGIVRLPDPHPLAPALRAAGATPAYRMLRGSSPRLARQPPKREGEPEPDRHARAPAVYYERIWREVRAVRLN